MVMEYMVGEDVQQLLRRVGPLASESRSASWPSRASLAEGARSRRRSPRHQACDLFLAKNDSSAVIVKLLDFGSPR